MSERSISDIFDTERWTMKTTRAERRGRPWDRGLANELAQTRGGLAGPNRRPSF